MFSMKVTEHWQRLTATRQDKLFIWLLGTFLLILGYLVGYWTAETRKIAPIIFQGIQDNKIAPQVLSDADIATLTNAVKATPAITPSAQVAGEEISKTTPGNNNFVASLNGTKYYFTSCTEVKRIKEENMVFFKTEQEAVDAGYEPSACVLKK